MIVGPKTITMMSDLVRFYPDVFVGGFRVDWYQVWKKKEAKKRFAGLTLTYGKHIKNPGKNCLFFALLAQ